MNTATLTECLTPIEQAVAAFVLGVLTAWLVIQETGLADRWDTLVVVLDAIILVASVGMWLGWMRYGLQFWDRKSPPGLHRNFP